MFRSTYDFIRAHYRRSVVVWPSVRAEIRACGLIIFIEAPLDMGWDSTVLCSDSCPTGFGVRAKHFEPSAVSDVGRWNERWRFKLAGGRVVRPRERALDPFSDLASVRSPH